MAHSFTPPSVIIVGAGIVGLCIAVIAQARGYKVTIVAREEVTASQIAAGMIAPALESIGDQDPEDSYNRLLAAQTSWFTLFELWPPALQNLLTAGRTVAAFHVSQETDWTTALKAVAKSSPMTEAERRNFGLADGFKGIRIDGDWMLPAPKVIEILRAHFEAQGGTLVTGEVQTVERYRVQLEQGDWLEADAVVVAAGYGSQDLAKHVPSLKALTPIKGQLLDLPGHPWTGIVRSASGYLAGFGSTAKFGATMEAGKDDLSIDLAAVAGLKARAAAMLPELDLKEAVPRAGVRAGSPDGWPMMGRDATSGVLVATAMRRNGFIFAPLAAQIIIAIVEGHESAGDGIYDPNRFG